MRIRLSLALLLAVLCCCARAAASASDLQQRCSSLCSVCESLHQTQVRRVCSSKILSHCGCEQFVIEAPSTANLSHCPAESGFCFLGHEQQDASTGCPTGSCSPPPNCPRQWRSSCPTDRWCPLGHRTDASGCPTCDCACGEARESAAACEAACSRLAPGSQHAMLQNPNGCPVCVCNASSSGSSSSGSGSGSIRQRLSSRCVHRCSNDCGSYGHANATADQHGCIADCGCRCPSTREAAASCPTDCPLTWYVDSYGCDACRCARPNEWRSCPPPPAECPDAACGGRGFRVDPLTGCRLGNCSCACPPAACPSDCRGRGVWTADAFGCAQCSCEQQQEQQQQQQEQEQEQEQKQQCPTLRCQDCGAHGYTTDGRGCRTCACNCPPVAKQCPGATCERWATDAFGCAVCAVCRVPKPCVTKATADMMQLCPAECKDFTVTQDARGCLQCACRNEACSPEPRCLIGCGPHPRKRDASGCVTTCDCDCPPVSPDACVAGCPFNATVVRDAFGCRSCKCDEAPRCPLRFRCANTCGSYGYQADDKGCQVSCKCNCPKRRCSCIFGSGRDEMGCENCQCRSFAEFVKDEFSVKSFD